MAYDIPWQSWQICDSRKLSNVHDYYHGPYGYHVKFIVERDEIVMKTATDTATGLKTFSRIEFDSAGWFGPERVMVSVLVSSQQDVEWLILKYPNAKYEEIWVA